MIFTKALQKLHKGEIQKITVEGWDLCLFFDETSEICFGYKDEDISLANYIISLDDFEKDWIEVV